MVPLPVDPAYGGQVHLPQLSAARVRPDGNLPPTQNLPADPTQVPAALLDQTRNFSTAASTATDEPPGAAGRPLCGWSPAAPSSSRPGDRAGRHSSPRRHGHRADMMPEPAPPFRRPTSGPRRLRPHDAAVRTIGHGNPGGAQRAVHHRQSRLTGQGLQRLAGPGVSVSSTPAGSCRWN